jgi:hypothetical protein
MDMVADAMRAQPCYNIADDVIVFRDLQKRRMAFMREHIPHCQAAGEARRCAAS